MASFSNFKSTIVSASNTIAGVTSGLDSANVISLIDSDYVSGISGGVTVYASVGNLPTSGNTAGDQAFVTATGRLYIYSGVGWYNVALINNTPTIQSVLDSASGTTPFALSTESITTTITITATDSDGDVLTYSATTDSDFTGLATISQDSSVFTITPLSQDSATTTSGTITFTATDGINTATSGVQTFTLNYPAILSELWSDTRLSVGTADSDGIDNDTFIDRSGNISSTIYSSNGTYHVQNAEHPYLDEWAVDFRRSTQNCALQLNSSGSGVNTGTGDFTIEGWYYLYDLSQSYSQLFYGDGGQFLVTSSGTLYIWSGYSHQTTLNAGRWYHIALMRSSGTVKWYIDGVAASSSLTNSTDYNIDYVSRDHASESWNGLISNFRMSNVARYNASGFTPPTTAFTSDSDTLVLTCNSNQFVDQSSNGYTVTSTSTNRPMVSPYNPFGQGSDYTRGENKGSLAFDVDSARAFYVAGSSLLNTWTVEMWYKHTPGTTIDTNHYLFDARGMGGGNWYMYRNNTVYATPQSGVDPAMTNDNFNNGEWHWITVVSDGTNMAYWLDGTRLATGTASASTYLGTGLWVNGRYQGNYQNDCKVADLRVSSTARYATSSTSITVPTSPVGYDGNTSAYYPMDNAGIFDKTGNHTIRGSLTTSTTQNKFDNTSIYLDGTQKLYITTDNIDFAASTPFTVEFWLYGNTGNGGIISWTGLIDQLDTTLLITSNNNLAFYSGAFITADSGGQLPGSQWNHVAMVRGSDNYIRLYVNGTLYNTSSSTYTSRLYKNYIEIGGYANAYFSGYIEGLQMLPGVAKYTANFTPPTQAQGRTYQAVS